MQSVQLKRGQTAPLEREADSNTAEDVTRREKEKPGISATSIGRAAGKWSLARQSGTYVGSEFKEAA